MPARTQRLSARPPALDQLAEPGPPLTVTQLAAVTGRCAQLVRADIHRGRLRAARHADTGPAGRYLVTRAAALAWVRNVLGLEV